MKRIFKISILLMSIILFSCSNGNKRYHIDETKSPNDTLTYLKSDMLLLNGIVFGEFGEFGKYVDGIKDGIHKEWYEDGQLKSKEEWINKKQISQSYFHSNGQLWFRSNKEEFVEYYDNGQISKQSKYKNGQLVGTHKTYYGSSGSLMIEIDKKIDRMWMWDKEGELIYEGKYDSEKSQNFYYDNYYISDY